MLFLLAGAVGVVGRIVMSSSSSSSSRSSKSSSSSSSEDDSVELIQPKPPLRPNNYYIRDNYKRVAREMGSPKSADVFARLNENWMTLSPQDKKPYLDKYEKDRERYRKELDLYRLRYKLRKKNAEAYPPKRKQNALGAARPRSAMQCFIRQEYPRLRQQQIHSTRKQLLDQLRDQWLAMDANQRAPFRQMQRDDVKRYEKQMLEFQKPARAATGSSSSNDENGQQKAVPKRRWFNNCRQQ